MIPFGLLSGAFWKYFTMFFPMCFSTLFLGRVLVRIWSKTLQNVETVVETVASFLHQNLSKKLPWPFCAHILLFGRFGCLFGSQNKANIGQKVYFGLPRCSQNRSRYGFRVPAPSHQELSKNSPSTGVFFKAPSSKRGAAVSRRRRHAIE